MTQEWAGWVTTSGLANLYFISSEPIYNDASVAICPFCYMMLKLYSIWYSGQWLMGEISVKHGLNWTHLQTNPCLSRLSYSNHHWWYSWLAKQQTHSVSTSTSKYILIATSAQTPAQTAHRRTLIPGVHRFVAHKKTWHTKLAGPRDRHRFSADPTSLGVWKVVFGGPHTIHAAIFGGESLKALEGVRTE